MENTIAIDGITISYIEKNTSCDKIIFFIHGNSSSSNTWRRQFQDLLFQDYHLIAIDLPGHRNSFHSKNGHKDYSPTGTAGIVAKVVSSLTGNKKYIIVAFSYGTNITAEMIAMDVKPAGIVLIGPCIAGTDYEMDKVFKNSPQPSVLMYNEGDRNVVKKFINEHFGNLSEPEIESVADDYFSVDQSFKPALFKGVAEGNISDEIAAIKELNTLVAVLFGENDQLVNNDYLDNAPFPLWNKTTYKIKGAGHWAYLDNAQETNRIIADYAAEIFKSVHA